MANRIEYQTDEVRAVGERDLVPLEPVGGYNNGGKIAAPRCLGLPAQNKYDRAEAREEMDTVPDSTQSRNAADRPFQYVYSGNFADILTGAGATLLISTYQAGKLVVVRADGGRLSALLRTFEYPMGVAADAQRMAVGTRDRIWLFRNAPDLARQLDPPGTHDACYVPRSCHITGDVRIHELKWARDELWFVNTRFSCLCTLHPDYSFFPHWRPPFISDLKAEDRCHLNGMEIVDSELTYATALGESDSAGGWRDNKVTGGCLMDIRTGEIVLRGLSMPHSPRVHEGRLWTLESGTGRLLRVDPARSVSQCAAVLAGFARGLDFWQKYAFIGLSKIRESSAFSGLPVSNRPDLKCGVAIVDYERGIVTGLLEFQRGVEEIFDVKILPGVRFPAVIGFQKDTVQNVFVVPEQR